MRIMLSTAVAALLTTAATAGCAGPLVPTVVYQPGAPGCGSVNGTDRVPAACFVPFYPQPGDTLLIPAGADVVLGATDKR